MTDLLSPALILVAGAALTALLRGNLRTAVIFAAPLATLWAIWQVPDGVVLTLDFLQYRIEPVEGSAVRRLFATIRRPFWRQDCGGALGRRAREAFVFEVLQRRGHDRERRAQFV